MERSQIGIIILRKSIQATGRRAWYRRTRHSYDVSLDLPMNKAPDNVMFTLAAQGSTSFIVAVFCTRVRRRNAHSPGDRWNFIRQVSDGQRQVNTWDSITCHANRSSVKNIRMLACIC